MINDMEGKKSNHIFDELQSYLNGAVAEVGQIRRVWHNLVDTETEKKKILVSNPLNLPEVVKITEDCNKLALKLRALYVKILHEFKKDMLITSVFELLMDRLRKDYLDLFTVEDKKDNFENRML